MSWVLPPSVEVKRVERVSPSSFRLFKKCPLRGAWTSARLPPFLPSSPQAYLGSIMHAVLEIAERGALRDPEDFEALWGELVKKKECMLLGSWMERHFVPLEDSVPKYGLKKSQCKRLALKIAEGAPVRAAEPGAGGCALFMESSDGLLAGEPDSIAHTPDGDIIVDYKTGHVLEPNGGQCAGIDEAYYAQLALYAWLYHDTTGKWPYALRIVGIDGKEHDLAYSPNKCNELYEEVKLTIGWVNQIIDGSLSDKERAERLATPKPEACHHCQYRPVCSAYWRAREKNEAPWPFDIAGLLTEKKALGNGTLRVKVEPITGNRLAIRGLKPGRHPALDEGQGEFSFFSLRQDKIDYHFREGPFTTIYKHG